MVALMPPDPVAPRRVYSGEQVAAMLRRSWHWFRKVRHDWTRDRDFPAELNEAGEPVIYDAEAIDRWMIRRSQRRPVAAPPPEHPQPIPAAERRVATDARARTVALRARAADTKGTAHA